MECKNSSPHSQQLDICSYSEPHQCISHLPWYEYFLKTHFHIVLHLRLGLPNGFFLQFSHQNTLPYTLPFTILLHATPISLSPLEAPERNFCSFLSLPPRPLCLPQHPVLEIHNLYATVSVWRQNSHPYKTTLKFIHMHIETVLRQLVSKRMNRKIIIQGYS